jgi:hypothetical protein
MFMDISLLTGKCKILSYHFRNIHWPNTGNKTLNQEFEGTSCWNKCNYDKSWLKVSSLKEARNTHNKASQNFKDDSHSRPL